MSDNIVYLILSVTIAPVLGLMAGLASAYWSSRGVLNQARVAASAEARLDRKQITDSYLGLIATLRAEVERLKAIVTEDRAEIVKLKASVYDSHQQYEEMARANTVLTHKVHDLETEATRMREDYDALEDKYAVALARLGHGGMGPEA